jgi:hypothetical protein
MRQLDSEIRTVIRDLARQWVKLVNIRNQIDEDKLISGTLSDAKRNLGEMVDRVWADYRSACDRAHVCYDIACWEEPDDARTYCGEHGRRRTRPDAVAV